MRLIHTTSRSSLPLIAAAGLTALLAFGSGPARGTDLPLPTRGTYSEADYEAALEEMSRSEGLPASQFELPGGTAEFEPEDDLSRLANDDNDSSHYARGSTVIIHVFVDHAGGTWSVSEMNAAGAKGGATRDYFQNQAPNGAYVSFYGQASTDYLYYNPTITQDWPADSGANYPLIIQAVQNLGFSDVDGDGAPLDDFTFFLQTVFGGWDNVVCVYQPADRTGRAFALYATGTITCYTDSDANTWRHEFGHTFGACDEYVEGGLCNGGINCGPCQSAYLPAVVDNGNCQLVGCGTQSCIMINNVADICDYTWEHWGWEDSNGDGSLDWLKRPVTGGGMVDIVEIGPGGGWYWTGEDADGGFCTGQQNTGWAAMGLWNPPGDDYDLFVYGDNNHNHELASSRVSGSVVDFIVGDYNHNNPGIEHFGIDHWSGPRANYLVARSTEGSVLFPDGVARSQYAYIDDVIQVFDLPLFAGEEIVVSLEALDPSLDLGVALFKSNHGPYWAGRASAAALQDGSGAGWDENLVYTVPEDDVYGLVVWNNDPSVDGGYDIRVGPESILLAEESPVSSSLSLRLYQYAPNAIYWSFVGTRPQAGDDVSLRLFDDPAFTSELGFVDAAGPGGLEFFAVDYNDGFSGTENLRVSADPGSGIHTTEWEHDPEIDDAITTGTWAAGHVGKVWDVHLTAGRNYFFRQYHDPAQDFDSGLYLFSSDDGVTVKGKAAAAASSDLRPAADGGEWFSYSAPATDWYGLYLVSNNNPSGTAYACWHGESVNLVEDVSRIANENVTFADAGVSDIYWTAFGVRDLLAPASVWLYGDAAYTSTTLAVDEQGASPVAFVVGDYNHLPTGTVYPRFIASPGGTVEWEGGSESLLFFENDDLLVDYTWDYGDVVNVLDVYIDGGSVPGGLEARFDVEDISGQLDLGLALFDSNGTAFYGNRTSAVATSDDGGVGGAESLTYTAMVSDWYGLVLYCKNEAGGDYQIHVYDPAVVAVEEDATPVAHRLELRCLSANPFGSEAELAFSLPEASPIDLAVFDVEGRRLRSLAEESVEAGIHTRTWDGRAADGRKVAAGVYVVRLATDQGEQSLRLVKTH